MNDFRTRKLEILDGYGGGCVKETVKLWKATRDNKVVTDEELLKVSEQLIAEASAALDKLYLEELLKLREYVGPGIAPIVVVAEEAIRKLLEPEK